MNMNMNIPEIEELDMIGYEAAIGVANPDRQRRRQAFASAIRDAVVAACRPQLRPIAEMPNEVPEGCVRLFAGPSTNVPYGFTRSKCPSDTHFIDITVPSPTYPSDFEAAFTESKLDAKDKAAAFKLWKGGAR